MKYTRPMQLKSAYTTINIMLLTLTIGISALHILFALKLASQIRAAKVEGVASKLTGKALTSQTEYFAQNPQVVEVIGNALPSQDGLIKLIETVEKLEEKLQITKSFTFTSPVPQTENNQYYLPFAIRFNATSQQTIDFLRQFEKIPYLTKINSLNIKTPGGVGGIYEVQIGGKVYVQDAFKN